MSSKYFFIALVIITAIASVFVALPFFTSIIAGTILAYIFYPSYKWMKKHIRSESLTAFITAVIIVLLVTVPAGFLIKDLTQDTRYMYLRAKQQIFSGEFIESRCYDEGFLCKGVNTINDWMRDEEIKGYLLGVLNDVLTFVTGKISGIIFSLPKIAIHLLVVLFTTYYMLKDGKLLIARIASVAPLKVHHQEEILKQFGDIIYAVIYGSLIVALIQGLLGAFGLWLFGIKNFIWWSIVMTFFALIPFIGTWVVWLPASMVLLVTGYLQNEPGLIWRGLGLFFYGLIIISSIDNILKPILVAERARVHPLLILVGVLGGLFVFGAVGILIGPIILAILQKLLEIYEREQKPHVKEIHLDILGKTNHIKSIKTKKVIK